MTVIKVENTFRDLISSLTGDVKTPQNWRSLVALASTTLTIGSLADAFLARNSPDVPDDVRDLLIDVRDRAQKRNQHLIGQFAEFLPALNHIGVRPIAMKGLARLLSNRDEHSRLLSDIDILVPAERLHDCTQALTDLRYEIIVGAEHDSFPPVLARNRDVGTVDMHTFLKPFYLKIGYDQIIPHCSPVALSSGETLLPNPTCQLLLLVLHDQLNDRDYWRGLIDVRHLIDMHCLVREGVDWPLLASFFPTGTSKRAFKLQMLTASTFSKINIPEEYRDGGWTKLQMLRRRIQARLPLTRSVFTLLTIALDPPREFGHIGDSAPADGKGILQKLVGRLQRYLWLSYPGKLR